MILGRWDREWKRKEFRRGITCGRPGCTRRARHQWAAPCAVNTLLDQPDGVDAEHLHVWVPLCDECDLLVNRVLLAAFGYPADVVDDLLTRYRMVQADGAFD